MYISDNDELCAAVERMRAAGTDLAEYELKSAAGGFPKSMPDSISSFANTNGGVIVFGIKESGGFHVTDIDVKTVQSRAAQAARELVEPPQSVGILVLELEGKPVVVVNVPEAAEREKPCYVKRLGQRLGSYIRTGDGDHKMSSYEIDRFIENQHRCARNDSRVIPDAAVGDFNRELLEGWLARVRMTTLGRGASMTDEELLANRRVISADRDGVLRPTIAGMLALGDCPQKYLPRMNIVFTVYPSTAKGELGSVGERFVDSVDIDGPIPMMVVEAVRAVSRNMKHGAVVEGVLRDDVPDYPLPALREAIANALMHRDYSPDAQGTPVMIDMYPDRLEISNPGGLFGALTVDKLGQRGATASRNQFLARILEDVPYTDFDGRSGRVVENRGSGFPTISRELAEALLPDPVLKSSLDEFCIRLRHRRMTVQEGSEYSKENVRAAVVKYLTERESASTAELARASGMSAKTIRGYLSRLMQDGLVEAIGTINSPKRRYRIKR